MNPVEVVGEMLERIQQRDWEGMRCTLDPQVVVEWVATGETFSGADDFVAVQREYPEGWDITVLTLVSQGPVVVSEIEVPHEGVGLFRAVSFWRVEDGLITSGREYWSSPASEEPPAWRRRYHAG